MIQRYLSKVSGLLLDRIDPHIEVPAVSYREQRSRETGEKSESIRDLVTREGEIGEFCRVG